MRYVAGLAVGWLGGQPGSHVRVLLVPVVGVALP